MNRHHDHPKITNYDTPQGIGRLYRFSSDEYAYQESTVESITVGWSTSLSREAAFRAINRLFDPPKQATNFTVIANREDGETMMHVGDAEDVESYLASTNEQVRYIRYARGTRMASWKMPARRFDDSLSTTAEMCTSTTFADLNEVIKLMGESGTRLVAAYDLLSPTGTDLGHSQHGIFVQAHELH